MAVEGTYSITAKALGRTLTGELVMKQNGNELTGVATGSGLSGEIQDGVVKGDTFTCKVVGEGPKGTTTVKAQGTVSGDHISGKLKLGPLSAKFEGNRV